MACRRIDGSPGSLGRLCTSRTSSKAADLASWWEEYALPLSQYSFLGQPCVFTASCSTACMPRGVLAVAPPVPDHVAGTVVEQREQHRPLALDDRTMHPVADPHLVGLCGFEPAKRDRRLPV